MRYPAPICAMNSTATASIQRGAVHVHRRSQRQHEGTDRVVDSGPHLDAFHRDGQCGVADDEELNAVSSAGLIALAYSSGLRRATKYTINGSVMRPWKTGPESP